MQVSPNAEVCRDFVEGYCPRGAECEKLHVYSAVSWGTGSAITTNNHTGSCPRSTHSSTAVGLNNESHFWIQQTQEDIVDEEGSTLYLALPSRASGLADTPSLLPGTTHPTHDGASAGKEGLQVGHTSKHTFDQQELLDSLLPNCLKQHRESPL